mmetsp:Transcript_67499/g.186246  ORF Transcript_67499/g.186246 Transcript_67499/m.186246 type:complete len:145 (+) Transcript_67499:713-1147(+)
MQYVPWNWHEPSKGIFDFESEGRNITRFVEIAQEVGLLVLMRAGPFMCGEWEFGGLPFYLINETQAYRTYDDVYISYVDRWWGEQVSSGLHSSTQIPQPMSTNVNLDNLHLRLLHIITPLRSPASSSTRTTALLERGSHCDGAS